jgi:hypothetical protein
MFLATINYQAVSFFIFYFYRQSNDFSFHGSYHA